MARHATLGASSASRWINCPGSVAASADQPDSTSVYAREGTVAHEVAAQALETGDNAIKWLGEKIDGFDVTEEMCEHVQTYIDVVREQVRNGGTYFFIEQKFTLNSLNPPAPMFGTADTAVYQSKNRRLCIDDLKYGVGVVVEAKNNPQAQYYALGALLAIEKEHPELKGKVRTIEIVIVQPRANHSDGPVRRWEIDYLDLIAFGVELLEAAQRTQEPNAPRVPGDWCRFCRAAAVCPEKQAQAMDVAQVEFGDLPESAPPAPETVPIETLAEWLGNMDILEDWIKSVRSHVKAALERGDDVPGWKLVAKRAMRRWVDEGEVRVQLQSMGFGEEEICVVKIKSPAQIDKLLGKGKSEMEPLWTKQSSGFNVAPDSDPRPAARIGPAEDFKPEVPLEDLL